MLKDKVKWREWGVDDLSRLIANLNLSLLSSICPILPCITTLPSYTDHSMLHIDKDSTLQSLSGVGLFISIIATVIAGISAYYAFCANKRSKRNEQMLADDELIVHGAPVHPGLHEYAHNQAVLRCRLVNKAKHRRVHVSNVRVFDRQDSLMTVTWCSSINHLGDPQDPGQAIPITESADLYIRRNDGENIDYAKIEVHHSFPGSPAMITYDAVDELFGDESP